MRIYLGELLKELEKVYPESLTVDQLRDKIASDVDGTIQEAFKRELINCPTYKLNHGTIGSADSISLGIKGFELLNQMGIKEAIEKFNKSSDRTAYILVVLTALLGVLAFIPIIPENVSISAVGFILPHYIWALLAFCLAFAMAWKIYLNHNP